MILTWFQWSALDRWVTLVARGTRADWSVHFGVAGCRWCTDAVKQTGILAHLHKANLRFNAVGIRLAGFGDFGRARRFCRTLLIGHGCWWWGIRVY